jgi:hypothetical protein
MKCREAITREQAAIVFERLSEMHRYTKRLVQRMQARQIHAFNSDMRAALNACDAISSLRMSFHYLACPGPTGESRRRGIKQGQCVRPCAHSQSRIRFKRRRGR